MSGNRLPLDVLVEVIEKSGNIDTIIASGDYARDLTIAMYRNHPDSVIHTLAINRRLDLIQYLEHVYPDIQYNDENMVAAILSGSIEIFDHMRQRAEELPEHEIDHAVESGSVELVKHLGQLGYQPTEFELSTAVGEGDEEMVEYLVELGIPITPDVISSAGKSGSIEMVKYLLIKSGLGRIPLGTLDNAIISGHYDLVKWIVGLMNPSANLPYSPLDVAYGTGNREIIELLTQHGFARVSPQKSLEVALEVGNIDVIKELAEGFVYVDLNQLTEDGKLEMLKIAGVLGLSLDHEQLYVAARYGQLDIIKWITGTVAFTPDEVITALKYAARGGHLEIFKFLSWYGLGRISYEDIQRIAHKVAKSGNVRMMEYIIQQFPVSDKDDLIEAASKEHRPAMVEYLNNVYSSMAAND